VLRTEVSKNAVQPLYFLLSKNITLLLLAMYRQVLALQYMFPGVRLMLLFQLT